MAFIRALFYIISKIISYVQIVQTRVMSDIKSHVKNYYSKFNSLVGEVSNQINAAQHTSKFKSTTNFSLNAGTAVVRLIAIFVLGCAILISLQLLVFGIQKIYKSGNSTDADASTVISKFNVTEAGVIDTNCTNTDNTANSDNVNVSNVAQCESVIEYSLDKRLGDSNSDKGLRPGSSVNVFFEEEQTVQDAATSRKFLRLSVLFGAICLILSWISLEYFLKHTRYV